MPLMLTGQFVGIARQREPGPRVVLVAEGVVEYPPELGRPAQHFVLRAGVPKQEPFEEIHE